MVAVCCSVSYETMAEESKVYDFNIHSQAVELGLKELAMQADVLLLFPYDHVVAEIAMPVVGKYSVQEALGILLQNTTLAGDVSENGVITVSITTADNKLTRSESMQPKQTKSFFGKLATMLGLAVGAVGAAHAEPANAGSSPTLEEIVVTAQRRQENLQDVPIAIAAFTADSLAKSGITGTDELTFVTPGLQMSRQIGSSTPFMRGIGTQNGTAGDESSIATYIDGVYNPTMIGGAFSFNNIERIEVLKGPQGTLFGRNATGGLVHVITKDPSHESSGQVELSYDNYETTGAKIYATTGLSENVAADIAIYHSDQGKGYGDNFTTGKEVGYLDTTAVRSKIVFDVSDGTTVKLGLNYSESTGDMGMIRPPAPGSLGGNGGVIFQGCVIGLGGNPRAPTGAQAGTCAPIAIAGATRFPGAYNDVSNFENVNDSRNWGGSLQVEHSMSSVDLLSITAYQTNDTYQAFDQDATPMPIINLELFEDSQMFSQEFQLSSNADGDFEWMVGVFYMDLTSQYDPFKLTGIGVPLSVPGASEVRNNPITDTRSYSAYFQSTYSFSDVTSLTTGIRYTKDERDVSVNNTANFNDGLGFVTTANGLGQLEDSWTEPTWRVSLDHKLTEEALLYISASRGFKSGVFNTVSVKSNSVAVDPEILDAIELGVKADLLDNRLRLNVAAFYYQYSDMQFQRISGGVGELLNAAESEITGLEADITWLATDSLTVIAGFALTDSEFTSFPDAPVTTPSGIGGNIQGPGDVSGNELVRTPDHTYNVTFQYDRPTEAGTFGANLNYYYNDGFFWQPENRLAQDEYSIVNVELSWLSPDEGWGLKVFGKNILDEEYSHFSGSSQLGDFQGSASPATYGAAVTFNF